MLALKSIASSRIGRTLLQLGVAITSSLFAFFVPFRMPFISEVLRHVRPQVIFQITSALGAALVVVIVGYFLVLRLLSRKGANSGNLAFSVGFFAVSGVLLGSVFGLNSGAFLQTTLEAREVFRSAHMSHRLSVETELTQETRVSVRGAEFAVSKFDVAGSYHRLEVGDKASGWLATVGEDSFLLAQGDGVILSGTLSFQGSIPNLRLESIPTNLGELLIPDVEKHGKAGLRGITYHEGFVVISATDQFVDRLGEPCWVTSLFIATYLTSHLDFKPLYRPSYCPRGHELELLESGGGLIGLPYDLRSSSLEPPLILFASGDYRDRPAAQDPSSDVGAILEISLANGSSQIIAKGVRNPQGFAMVDDGTVWFTEQGPEGGDEINKLTTASSSSSELQNFGWPVSSYGTHYGDRLQPLSPLLKSHQDYGFIEPSYFWVPSIGPAGISINPFADSRRGIVVASLGETPKEGDMSLLFLEPSDYSSDRLDLTDYLYMGERMRDVTELRNCILALGDDGSLRLVEEQPK